jgi:hypothetical protein
MTARSSAAGFVAGFLVLASVAFAADAPKLRPSGLVEIWPGTLPVVLSAPHGGTNKPASIPDRSYGTTNLDSFTRPLAYAVREAFLKKFGEAPPLVVCLLSRKKVDCNREIVEGAQSNKLAEQVWTEFQDGIAEAEKSVLKNSAHGMYFDIHAQGNPGQRTELGYGLSAAELAWPDEKLNEPEIEKRCTVRLISEASPLTFAEFIRGPQSFGALVEARGIPATPSPQRPLKAGVKYFSGGYNVRAYGSADGTGLDGIQLETPGDVRKNSETRAAFAKAVAEATEEYLLKNYGMKLGAAAGSK